VKSEHRYTLIAVDAYRPPYIPWHMTTLEFFKTVHEKLSDDGVLAINVGRSPTDRRLVDGLAVTVGSVFPSVHVMDIPGTFNAMIYATVQPSTMDDLYENLLYLMTRDDIHPLLLESLVRVVTNEHQTPSSGMIFSDDWAPIEWITNNMVLNYVLFGDIENLQEWK
jgi:hypothetical protein